MSNIIIGMPKLDIAFKYLGATALSRGSKGQAILIVKEEKEGEVIIELPTANSFDDELQETFSEENVRYIKETLNMQPRELIVIRMGTGVSTFLDEGEEETDIPATLNAALKLVGIKAEKNCWIAVTDPTPEESEELATFVDEENKFNEKRYKAVVYDFEADSQHVVNYVTPKVKFVDEDKLTDGIKTLPMMLGAVAGQPLNSSLITKKFPKIEYVVEPEGKNDELVDEGKLFLVNDEKRVRVARAVNSLTTITQGMSQQQRFILVTEVCDLIYTDIHFAWVENYRGYYKNNLDNQMLFVSAINGYFREISAEDLLDRNFDNRAEINVEKQKLANIPIYGEDEVAGWDTDRAMSMTVGTNVYLKARIKILNAMEDLEFDIFI